LNSPASPTPQSTGPARPSRVFAGFRGTVANDAAALTEFNTSLGNLTLDGTLSGSGGLLKNGPNSLVLTGSNAFTGPAHVAQGRLVLCDAHSLGPHPELTLDAGTTLELKFNGQMTIRKLVIAGKPQPVGVYGEAQSPNFIGGPGTLQVRP